MFNQITPISSSQERDSRTTCPIILAIILIAWIGLPAVAWPTPELLTMQADKVSIGAAADEELPLEPGKPIERELSGGGSHFYKITLTSGQYLRISVSQKGIDLLVALYTPDGKKIGEVDSEQVTVRSETISTIAAAAGAYRIEARSADKTAKTGRYEIMVGELREATAEDKYRVAAESLSLDAGRLMNGTLEEKRKGIEKYQEALELYRKAGDRRREAETMKDIGNVYFDFGDIKKALEMFNMALPISQTISDRILEAEIIGTIGTAYMDSGETQEALGKYNESLAISQAIGYHRNTAIILACIGVVYRTVGEMQKALDKFYEALPILREVGDRAAEAGTLSSIASVHGFLGEMRKALDQFNEALLIHRARGDRMEEARTLSNIGAVYSSLGEPQKELEKYSEALAIQRAVGDRMGEATTLNNISGHYRSLGEMQKAMTTANEALAIVRALGDRIGESESLSNVAAIYSELGETQKALEKYNETLAIQRAVSDRMGEAATLNNIGVVYLSSGGMQKALEKFNEALPIRRTQGDRIGEAVALDNIGSVYRLSGEMRKAMEKHKEALQIIREVGVRSYEAGVISNVGKVYLLSGEAQSALEKFNEALPIWRALGDRDGEANALLGIARAEHKRGNLTQSRQIIERVIGIIESLRAGIRVQNLRSSYFASRREYYESYIDILMEQHMQHPSTGLDAMAFEVSERARARALLELLTESRIDVRQGVDSSLLERERSLRQRLAAKATAQAKLLNRKHTPEQAEAAAKEIASIIAEYEELEAQIRASSPKYAALTQPQPLKLSEIQKQILDPETLLLEYSLGENASYLFLVSQTSIASYQLPKRAEIDEATRRVRELLTAPQHRPGETAAERRTRIKEARANYWPQATALSQMLLGPAASRLGAKRLLIVADGALQYLPFGALPAPKTERRRDGETRRQGDKETRRQGKSPLPTPYSLLPTPLIVNHEIVHLPSASALAVLRRELAGRQPAAKAVAVLADPVFSADDPRVKTGAKAQASKEIPSDLTRAISDVRGELGRLLMTRDEAENILSAAPRNDGFAALGFRASRATATGEELSDYRIVHFATHGLLNSEHPELSGLVLSLVDERGRPQDGFLRMHEIFNLRLPAELVVLSACETGLGKEIKGEGLVGLTRGFMYAGAARVVASLWEVNDAATAELMKRFYRRLLRDGMRPSAALRAAQIEMWKKPQWQSPFYWGAFALQGEWK